MKEKTLITIHSLVSEYEDKGDLEIISEFSKICDETRTQIKKEMMELVKKRVSSYEDYKDLIESEEPLMEYNDITDLLGETGCPICKKENKLFLGDCTEPNTGAGCNIDYGSCKRRGGEKIGSFHTHPLGGTTPSLQDMVCSGSQEEKISCIGGLKGKGFGITCYTLNERGRSFGILYNPFLGKYYPDTEKPDGKIEFYRETPPPTASQLLEDLNDETIGHIVINYFERDKISNREKLRRIERFKNALKRGEIPDEYWENYESEGEMDSLDVYSPKKLEKVEKERKAFLSRDTFLCEL